MLRPENCQYCLARAPRPYRRPQTFLIDTPLLTLFGAFFAFFSRPSQKRLIFCETAFWHGIVFSALFCVAVVYAAIKYPDWMWMYFIPDSRMSLSELLYVFVFLYDLPYVLGYYLGKDLKGLSLAGYIAFLTALALVEVWLIAHLFARYAVIGTLDQFQNGTAVSLFGPDNPLAPVMNTSLALMALYLIFVVYLHKRNKKQGNGS